ncbi:5-formyltetrahydrofolate cyclo-ligase [Limnobacter sp.]|uniref:5-formyltetrahydrofolate cyclo-ligase n=1 Tax=Limnobacter sp. TaxID=2003368 RepID=UPI002FE078A9
MKKSLRQNALAYRTQLAGDEIPALGREISKSLLTLLQTFKPCTVGLFYPTQGEPDILCIMGNSLLEKFEWALPVCCESPTGPVLGFAQFAQGQELEPGRYNIAVPKTKNWVQPDVLLIPCVAFHRNGARLGYGAGWYDRTLNSLTTKPLTVGVAYAKTELLDNFAEPHDQLLDHVVTEQAVITCSRP